MAINERLGNQVAQADDLAEIELKIAINSKGQQGTAFIVDLSYCGLVGMRNLDEASMHAFTYAEAPRILQILDAHSIELSVRSV